MVFLRTFIKRITKCLLAQRPISPLFPTWLIMVYVVDSCVAGINVWSLGSWQQPPWVHPAFSEQLLDGTLVNERLQIQLRLPVCSSLHVCLSASSVLSTLCRGRKGAQAPVQMSLCAPPHTLSYTDHLHRKIVSTERFPVPLVWMLTSSGAKTMPVGCSIHWETAPMSGLMGIIPSWGGLKIKCSLEK